MRQQAPNLGLDPNAVIAVASQEGIGGGIGDSGTSFGPFQLHAGGALPSGQYTGPYSAATNAWAWSKQGIDYALQQIASVAQGLTGGNAISAIVTGFERPANAGPEIAGAQNTYATLVGEPGAGTVGTLPGRTALTGGQTISVSGVGPGASAQGGMAAGGVTVATGTADCQDWQLLGSPLPGTHIFCSVGNFFAAGGWGKILLTLLAAGLIIGGAVIYFKGDLPAVAV